MIDLEGVMITSVRKVSLVLIIVFLCVFCSLGYAATRVLFDEGHAQQFLIDGSRSLDLSDLADSYRELGFEVDRHSGALTEEVLSAVDVLVISGAFKPLASEEVQAVVDFINNGGGLAVMLHIAPPLGGLLHRLDVDFTNGTLREAVGLIENNPLDFKVDNLHSHPVTDGLSDFSLYGSWALRSTASHVIIIAETTDRSWVDLDRDNKLSANDAVQKFGVMAAGELGRGRYLVIGDDAVFQNRFFDQNNRELAWRLVEWLSFR
jgi:hypothetical protein